MSKIIAALVSGLFAVTVFAAEPAKKDAPAAKPAAAPAAAAAKPADAAKK
jgi:hypothetical protein